jgi:hypothetical protein
MLFFECDFDLYMITYIFYVVIFLFFLFSADLCAVLVWCDVVLVEVIFGLFLVRRASHFSSAPLWRTSMANAPLWQTHLYGVCTSMATHLYGVRTSMRLP